MISPSGSARHFPVQQRERIRRDGTALTDDRSAVLFLAGFALAAAAAYAALAPFLGPVAASGWVSVSIIGATALAAFIAAYRGAVRVAVLTTVVGLGVASVVLLVIAGRQAPSAELFTITVVLAALAAGRRAAIALMVTATLLLAAVWWWLPDGIDPVAGELIGRRRPIADIELLVFGSLIALWWSRRTERTAREHHRLLGNEQIIETLQQAVASSRAGIAITDANGVLTYANEALLDMWRVADPRAAVGRHVFSFWDEPEVAQAALIGFSEGTVPVAKLRGRRDDGSTFDVEVSGSRVVGPDGSVEGHIGSFVDVSERTIAEEQLQVERERTRAIVESVLDIVVILDAHGTIVFENAAVQRVLGFMPGERVGQSILMHAHPDDMARAGSAM
ncbi:MAG: PAS domain-containing protein, partial [Acidobacteria bacterium]|nr:PAS domain-containing protein [Acidobacteriota bacterium]